MENTKTTIGSNACNISTTKIYSNGNNELICLKIYNGDWGDWDEKPKQSNLPINSNGTRIQKDKNSEAM